MGGKMLVFVFMLSSIILAGIGVFFWIEDTKTSESAKDRFDALERKMSHLESDINHKISNYMADVTEAIEKDLARRVPSKPNEPIAVMMPKIQEPVPVRIIGTVNFKVKKPEVSDPQPMPARPSSKSTLPKSIMPKTKPSER